MVYLIKALVILTLIIIVGSLFSALYYLLSGKGGPKMARALTIRISLSIGLFLILFLLFYLGVFTPHRGF